MTKVVHNACFGGFSLSEKAAKLLEALGVRTKSSAMGWYIDGGIEMHDPRLVQVVEQLGLEASGPFARLEVAEIRGNRYRIEEYDGFETVEEPDDLDWIEV